MKDENVITDVLEDLHGLSSKDGQMVKLLMAILIELRIANGRDGSRDTGATENVRRAAERLSKKVMGGL